jgi:murein DD-endopeptidase MepM/ murein hydrolase activator NlpD
MGGIVTGRAWGVIALILLLAVAGGGSWVRCEGTAPTIEAPETLLIGRAGIPVLLRVSDPDSGVREVGIRLRHEKGEQVLFEKAYAGNPFTGGIAKPGVDPIEIAIDPESLGMGDGAATLAVSATDWSWAELFSGNRSVLEIPIRVDLEPPQVWVQSGLTYVHRGGAAAVVYSIDEPTSRDGIEVGDTFFPGFPFPTERTGQAQESPSGRMRFAIFAVPRNAPANAAIRAVGVDEAGNRTAVSWPTRIREREFPEVRINLGGTFLSSKVPELASSLGVKQGDAISTFQKINSETRAANELRIREIVATSSPERYWRGAFQQLRNSAVTSLFAEHRSYFAEGEKVSEAIHYGYDLASTAGAPITAANAGRVIFRDALGIYGNCVVIDHGLGVTSVYAHLSRIDVRDGDMLEKGDQLGLSGATGLAGGDHLHFAILVGSTYVDPKEWWDPRWVHEHIEARLALQAP